MGLGRRTVSSLWLALIWPAIYAVALTFTNSNPTQCDPLTVTWQGAYTPSALGAHDEWLIIVPILCRGTTTVPVVDDLCAYTLYLHG